MREALTESGRCLDRAVLVVGLCLAVVAARAADADAEPVASAQIDLHLNGNTFDNLSELGVLSGIVEPAHFARVDIRFPLDRGHLHLGPRRRGKLHGLGGVSFFREDGRTVAIDSPSIVIRKHTARLFLTAQGHRLGVAYLPQYEITHQAERFEVKGLTRFSQAGASLMNGTFASTYPHPGTPLGVLDIKARLGAPSPADRRTWKYIID
jgi:hypothetical protein